jgi:hypothetical protein
VVKQTGSPYVVAGDITVPAGENVIVEEGVCFLFRGFTGLLVHGTLLAQGSADNPIVFTSENDPACGSASPVGPAPYDWNGITVSENALGTTFEHCAIRYSLYGINALADYVILKECSFSQNGRSNFVIKGVEQETVDPFTYVPEGMPPPGSQVPLALPEAQRGRTVFRFSSFAVLLAGAAVGAWQAYEYRRASARFAEVNDDTDPANLTNPSIVEDWDSAKSSRDRRMVGMSAGFAAGLAGGLSFVISLF